MLDKLQVTVRSRMGLVFEGELEAVTSYNMVGEFDVLPQHANFISMIRKKLILHKSAGKQDEMNIDKGVLMVNRNKVQVFIGVGTL